MSETLQPSHGGTSSTGLDPNVAAGLAYLFSPVSALVIYFIEKNNAYVRFHAAQSLVFAAVVTVAWIALSVLGMVLGVIPILGWIASLLLMMALGLGSTVLWVMLMIKAFTGNQWEAPMLAPYAHKLLASNIGQ